MKTLRALVGMQHRGTMALVAKLPGGEPLTLIREPTNKFDPNAIQVWARDVHVGYVKATQAASLARYIELKGVESLPAKLAIDGGRWPMVEVDEDDGRAL